MFTLECNSVRFRQYIIKEPSVAPLPKPLAVPKDLAAFMAKQLMMVAFVVFSFLLQLSPVRSKPIWHLIRMGRSAPISRFGTPLQPFDDHEIILSEKLVNRLQSEKRPIVRHRKVQYVYRMSNAG